ncbi:hypothetical protein [Bacillus sp. FJAT-27251]|uniref:hypothetical protein n=1 Tax=Bacillus sp. FJAT-27251 TaxID=1684142 RepID=UPI0006A799D8|nr:hypothetical protein [Bacillus sp. FJAT-27251]
MPVIQYTILNNEPPVIFAKEELQKFAEKVQGYTHLSFVLGLDQDFVERGLLEQPVFQADSTIDAFQLIEKESEIYILGSNPRSVLFGVYHACKKLFGYKWVSFLSKEKAEYKPHAFELVRSHSGLMKRRGLVVENYDDKAFLLKLIDWAGKHYINELFFTFMLWDKVKGTVEEEIVKRGLSITLGGHSMHYLLNGTAFPQKKQVDFTDDSWKSLIINKIKDYDIEESINRISLWPADIGIEGEQHFLAHYMEFTEKIQNQLPEIEVEHIAYNAGLSWDMLELPDELESSKTVNTLFAFWGRNYQQSFFKEERAYEALQKWCNSAKANQKQVTIFEYYSDHFMLGDLFPPLFYRIRDDMALYSSLGIENIVNLIVPYVPKENGSEKDNLYPWESIQLMNSYYFARTAWGDAFDDIEADFYSIFGKKQDEVKKVLSKMESVLSEVSKWNIPLFPQRLIDPEKVESDEKDRYVIADLKKWKKEIATLEGNPHQKMDHPYTMVSFYVHYVSEKLNEYLLKWNQKKEN